MGYHTRTITVTGETSRGNGPQDQVDRDLFKDLSNRIKGLVSEDKYRDIAMMVDTEF